jgi:hypothetical protein
MKLCRKDVDLYCHAQHCKDWQHQRQEIATMFWRENIGNYYVFTSVDRHWQQDCQKAWQNQVHTSS